MPGFSVAISAGGKSSRMGTDKALVRLRGKPLIEHLLARVENLGQDATFIVTNRPAAYAYLNLPMFPDVLPDKGSLGGIYTALSHSHTSYTLVLACDMPFVSTALLGYMLDLCTGDNFDVIVPRTKGYPEGLHAIYSPTCLAPMRACLDADRLKVTGFYDAVRVCYLDEDETRPYDPAGRSFFNVNTPEELGLAEAMLREDEKM